jgi:hypothetical protein
VAVLFDLEVHDELLMAFTAQGALRIDEQRIWQSENASSGIDHIFIYRALVARPHGI